MLRRMMMAGASSPPATDPYFSNVASLLHFNTDFTDQKGKVWTPTNTPTIDSASKFGAGCLSLDDGDILSTPNNVDFLFGTGDFTIEGWFQPLKDSTGYGSAFFYDCGINTSAGLAISLDNIGRLEIRTTSGNRTTLTIGITSAAYGFLSISRVGNTLYIGANGTVVTLTMTGINVTHTGAINIGYPASYGYGGRIDDIRITKGIARYTADYTPPAAPFPDA